MTYIFTCVVKGWGIKGDFCTEQWVESAREKSCVSHRKMMATSGARTCVILLFLLIVAPHSTSSVSVSDPSRTRNSPIRPTSTPTISPRPSSWGFLLMQSRSGGNGRGNGRGKGSTGRPETPPRPQAQVMLSKNATADALGPPLGAAQVAPPPRRLVEVDVCRGYYDVMGQYDLTFNCSKDDFIYCCGTCHYRFCCPDRTRRLDQNVCHNYHSPVWANTAPPGTKPPHHLTDPDLSRIEQSNNTIYVIGGVISFTVAVAVAIKLAFNKASRQARNRELNMPRALVDMLRHQSSPVQQGERNNSVALGSGGGEGTLGRPPKNLYPTLQSKDNRREKMGNLQHNFIHTSGSSPKHTATIERAPRMNNMQMTGGGTLKPNKHTNAMKPQPSFHHSLHNLAQLPPSYEAAMKPELNRYSSLKRLEKGGLEEYSGYCTTKRRPNNAPPSFHSSQHHLPWGGDYTLGGRGTLPTHATRPRIPHPQSAPSHTPNPYPLEPKETKPNQNYDTLSKPPRRVKSTDQLLALADGNTLSRLSKNQQHQYYKAMNAAAAKNSNTQNTLRKSKERLLMSPDHLEEEVGMSGVDYGSGGGGMGMGDYPVGGGMVPTLPRNHQKAQSQQNVCATPSLDRHHMIKMNSHPTSGREQERNAVAMSGHLGGGGGGGMGWNEMQQTGVVMGTGTLGGHSARRLAFAAKRQNTIEQLHFIPGGGGSSGSGVAANQGVRTGSKNEVTV
ncbi:protein shisa-7 isoform X1 [Silurus meridionalis]|uniref:protein shisa-7 isoform X1 n=1 Tax=Silurus meridionalis TaxID=175797 RepID=UPI001EEC63CC|nr:protein shisa-7 isoform X1 [Silurus meridionalis]XP_046704483.1 protein shisa-7 isoform X1 [Silurus meridionalis]XP_046704484.1 protein shisa-7 isoform X1 [Silurus meridionalis]